DQIVDLERLGQLPSVGADALLGYVPGRGLSALVAASRQRAPAGVGFIPMVRHVKGRAGRSLLVVGLINPDVLANQQQQLVADTPSRALLAGLKGQVLAAAVGGQEAPGDSVAQMPVFGQRLAEAPHGSYRGMGSQASSPGFTA
ncbi:MAG: PAS domain-containing sensor histidine kinase, partial [Rubrivivax sp.]